jgi:hypothetical protein
LREIAPHPDPERTTKRGEDFPFNFITHHLNQKEWAFLHHRYEFLT